MDGAAKTSAPRPPPIHTLDAAPAQGPAAHDQQQPPQQQPPQQQPPQQQPPQQQQQDPQRPPSPEHEPLTLERWLGRAKFMLFGKKDPNPQGVAARKDFGWLILGGSLLCFVAGWVNAFAIVAARATVTHVTGSTTKAGMALADGDGAFIGFAFGIWACFVLGGAVSGIIIVKDTFAMGRGYGHALLLISALLLWASAWVIHFPDNHGYLFLMAAAMGIQNGLTTRYSGNVVRTTHMTGLSTDIGITIGHVLRCHPKPERWKLKMYVPMLVCFFLGAAAGKSAFDRHGRSSLLLPAFFLFFLGWGYIWYLARIRRQPFHRVLLKRVSNEILTPHSPSHARKPRLTLPVMPQIHIPFSHPGLRGMHLQRPRPHHSPQQHPNSAHHHQQQLQEEDEQQQQAAHHGRRHSSACDELGKKNRGSSSSSASSLTAGPGGEEEQQIVVLDISAPGAPAPRDTVVGAAANEAAPAAGAQESTTNEVSNHTAAVV